LIQLEESNPRRFNPDDQMTQLVWPISRAIENTSKAAKFVIDVFEKSFSVDP
jgi:hypothetical protein